MVLAIIFWALLVSVVVFAVVGGAVVFNVIFMRKNDVASHDIKSLETALTEMSKGKNGEQIEGVKMRDLSVGKNNDSEKLSAHVNDKKIMIPILEAKIRWLKKVNGTNDNSIERVFVYGERNTKLAGYFVKATLTNPDDAVKNYVAVLVHGYTDSAAGMAYLAEEYLSRGVSVLAVDCRAHGNSEGNVITMGYTDAHDISVWLKWLSEKFSGNVKIILHGVSMGAASVMQAIALESLQPLVGNFSLVVADCGFSSMTDQLTEQIGLVIGEGTVKKIAAHIMITGMSFLNFLMCGFFFRSNSAKTALKKRRNIAFSQVPILFFHGENDALVPHSMMLTLEKSSGGVNAIFVTVPDAPHIGSYFYAPERYMSAIFDLLAKRG